MTPDAFREITSHGAAVDLSARAKFRLTGADRVRYLNGQVTNDVRRASASQTLYACVTDLKGRIAGDIFIRATVDALWIDAEPDLREALGMRLERYIVADDVELTDVTDDFQLWHEFGPKAVGELASNRFAEEGVDHWIPAGESFQPNAAILSAEDAETWRIVKKVPRWPNELNTETFPPEAGLEARAMDFQKGCYIGQEVLSRIKTTGKMPRQLISLECEAAVQIGDELWLDKAVGKVTSVTIHPVTNRLIALAMVRQGTDVTGLRLGRTDGPVIA